VGFGRIRGIGLSVLAFVALGCARAPSPLAPQFGGSIGMPHRGVLTSAVELPAEGEGYKWRLSCRSHL
jgi:hypothetical protein